MGKVIIMRGIPRSGKSTWVGKYCWENRIVREVVELISTDNYFYTGIGDKTVWKFDPTKIGEAHSKTYLQYLNTLAHISSYGDTKNSTIIVDNTNIHKWEINPYLLAASAYDWDHEIITIFTPLEVALQRKNEHNVPDQVIYRMHQSILKEELLPFWNHRVITCGTFE